MYVCMHENYAMTYRMDVDQAARSNAQEYFGVVDPDYYEFEGKHSICINILGYWLFNKY